MVNFNISISLSPTKSVFGPLLFSGDLDKGLECANKLGYDAVELSLRDSNKIDFIWLSDKLKSLSLSVSGIGTGQTYYTDGYSLYSIDKNKREKAIDRFKSHIDLSSKLGAKTIIGGIRGNLTENGKKKIDQKDNGKLALRDCVEYAKRKNVTILLEAINRYETNLVNTLEEGITLIEDIGSSNLMLHADTFHMNIEEKSLEDSLIKAKSYLAYIHFADSNRLAPGWGHIDFRNIISTLKKISYKGTIGIEVLPKPDDYKAAKQAIDYLNLLFKAEKK